MIFEGLDINQTSLAAGNRSNVAFNSQQVQEVRGGLSHQGDHEHPAKDKNQNNISEVTVNQMKLQNCLDQHVNCDETQTYHTTGDTVLTRGTRLSL